MVERNILNSDTRMVSQYEQASAAKQSGAAFCDLVLVAVIGICAGLLSHSALFAVICCAESVLVLAVWEAVRGSSPGRLLCGIRSVRSESVEDPRSGILPAGMMRIARKYAVLCGSCVCVIGLPIALCSPLFSRSGMGWADRAAKITQVDLRKRTYIAVPRTRVEVPDYSVSDESLDVHIAPPALAAPVAAARALPVPTAVPVPAVSVPRTGTAAAPSTSAPKHAVPAVPAASVPDLPAVSTENTAAPAGAQSKQQLFIHFSNGTSMPLVVPSAIVLGRKPVVQKPGDITIRMPDDTGTVSRSHARLELLSGQWWISDLGSTNGTRISEGSTEHVVPAHQRIPLTAGTRILLGETSCSIITTTRRDV